MRTIVSKFGGTSAADAVQFRKIKKIIEEDPDRRYVIVSAPGKRFPRDQKVTDLLNLCYESAIRRKDYTIELNAVKKRFEEIIQELELEFPLEECLDELRARLEGFSLPGDSSSPESEFLPGSSSSSETAPLPGNGSSLKTEPLSGNSSSSETESLSGSSSSLKTEPLSGSSPLQGTDCSDRSVNNNLRAYVLSRGEYLCARILALYLGFTFVDPEWCVCFKEDGTLDDAMTRRALGAALRPLSRAVIAGFYGAEADGTIHTFSRGGSDVTGSLVACAIHADLYENWTDVPGLLAADPRIVPSPKTVEYMSYRELRTLSYMGASVLHTDSVLPASDLGIPINIRNTNTPEDPGTMIVRRLPREQKKYPIIGVAGRKGMSVIQVEKVMVSDGSGFSAIMLDLLKERQLPFEQCLTGIDSITLVIRSDLLEAWKEELFADIRSRLNPDFIGIKEHLSMIAVVGEKGTESSDANVTVLRALTEAGIEISTINQGAGKLNLLIGVPEDRYEDAVRAIYSTF